MQDINKQFYNYLWAYVLVALSGCLGNVVDGIIVGNLISADGVSAINLSKPINQFIFTLHLLINAGAGMLVAYALGQKDVLQARRYFSFSLSLSWLSSGVCSSSTPPLACCAATSRSCPWLAITLGCCSLAIPPSS